MIALLCFFLTLLVSPFKSKSRLEAENVALRRQLVILRRRVRGRVHLTNGDRLFLVQLYRWFPSVLNTITIIRPETLCCRKIDRINPARVRRPYRRTGRDAFAPSPKILCQILQWNENPPIVGQRCAYLARGPAGRQHHVTCSPRWTASPLHPSLSFRYTQESFAYS
jgi:hypothetical protein